MNTLLRILALSGLATLPVLAQAADSPHSLSGNVGLYSDYAFRGQSQTDAELALQGGFDYAHSSGVYLGTWASNVDTNFLNGANLELDVYGGYGGKAGDIGYNVGLLKYYYPGQTAGTPSIDTLEAYAGVNWKWFGLKVSYNLDDYFGIANSDGTVYWDASFSYELPAGVTLSAHYGSTKLSGTSPAGLSNSAGDYEDWKVGVAKEFGGFNFGLAYTDTDITVASPKPGSTEDLAEGRWILSVGKSF